MRHLSHHPHGAVAAQGDQRHLAVVLARTVCLSSRFPSASAMQIAGVVSSLALRIQAGLGGQLSIDLHPRRHRRWQR